eukprot:gb/GECH01009983.1/.p1 GENE.gb/GECH01009983.1/~~gb/GECH01009983.1/.p1  ORF type:complete len:158 (+),score=25.91 gb/GECH01009983.1/:1-474(+)
MKINLPPFSVMRSLTLSLHLYLHLYLHIYLSPSLGHGAEKLSIQRILSIFQIISAGLFDFSIHTSQIALDLAIANPYSRLMEKEADTIGIKLMAKACFDPRAAPQVMEKLADVQGGSSLMHYLSTHPPDEERIAELYQLEPEAFDIMMRNCPPGRRR